MHKDTVSKKRRPPSFHVYVQSVILIYASLAQNVCTCNFCGP